MGLFRTESRSDQLGNLRGLLALKPFEVKIRALSLRPFDDHARIALFRNIQVYLMFPTRLIRFHYGSLLGPLVDGAPPLLEIIMHACTLYANFLRLQASYHCVGYVRRVTHDEIADAIG